MCDRAMMMPPGCIAPTALRGYAFSFPGRRDQVSRARAFVAQFLGGHPVTNDAVLLVSELAANACAHSASGRPGGMFMVRVEVGEGDRVYVEVEDQGSSWTGSFEEHRESAWAVPRVFPGSRVRYPPGCPRMGDLVCARPTVTSGISLETALVTARQALASVAERAKQGGYYSGARTDIINAHADLRAALDMLVKAAGPDDSGTDRLADLMPEITDAR